MRPSLPIRLAILLFVVIGVRLFFLGSSRVYQDTPSIDTRNAELGWDGVEYVRYAKNLAFHGTFSHSENAPYVPSAFRTPAYPVFLAPFCRFSSTDPQLVLWITLAQIGLAGINALLTYGIASRLTGSSILALAASALASLDLCSILLNFQVMTETLFLTLFLLAVWLFLRYLAHGRGIDLIGFSVVLALSGLCRSISLYSIPVFLLFLMLHETNLRKRLAVAAVVLLTFFLTLSPWVARNWYHLKIAGVSTLDSYARAVIATGLLQAEINSLASSDNPAIWNDLETMYDEALDELRERTKQPVTFDSGINLMIAIDHPELTPQLATVIHERTNPIIRQHTVLYARRIVTTFLHTFIAADQRLLFSLLGRKEPDSGLHRVLNAVASGQFKEAKTLLGKTKWDIVFNKRKMLAKICTHGYAWLLLLFGLIGTWAVLSRRPIIDSERVSESERPPSPCPLPQPRKPSGQEGERECGAPSPTGGAGVSFPRVGEDQAEGDRVLGGEKPVPHQLGWWLAATLIVFLLALPACSAAFAGDLPRYRVTAVPFIAIFAVVGMKSTGGSIRRYMKTKSS